MPRAQRLGWGEPAPFFTAPALGGSNAYQFDTVAGRHVLMLFFGSAGAPGAAEALALVQANRDLFDDERACFFGVTINPGDAAGGAIRQQIPGIRFFLDYDRAVSSLYGATDGERYRPHWLLLDPQLTVVGGFAADAGDAAFAELRARIARPFAPDAWAPVLTVPHVLEPQLCRTLIDLYERDGGEESGFMREVDGKTVLVLDPAHKRRRDVDIADERLRKALAARINTRLRPQLHKVFQFDANRMERYIVACYQAGAGHFRAHRDNTTRGTAHRRFAVTINLNADDYEGGDLRFPEFGPRTYRAPTGGAVVFSCALLHEATPVTRGKRYAFLPFLYDDAAAEVRAANNAYLGEGVTPYRPSAAAVAAEDS